MAMIPDGRKHPYKRDRVPDSAIMSVMLKYRTLFSFLHAEHKDLHLCRDYKVHGKKYNELYGSIPAQEAKEIIKREFNFSDNYINSGVLYRCIRIWGKYQEKGMMQVAGIINAARKAQERYKKFTQN